MKSQAVEVFGRTKFTPETADIQELAQNMALLQEYGMEGLNNRLLQARTKIFDTIAEHNIAAQLLRHLDATHTIVYEPADYSARPIDFRVSSPTNTFCIQMKRFSALEIENRRDQLLARIEQEAARVRVPKFFALELDEQFSDKEVHPLLEFLRGIAQSANDGVAYNFQNGTKLIARIEFWQPQQLALGHLTLGSSSDMHAVNMTGLAADQIRMSVRKAASAFIHPAGQMNINLVFAEADRYEQPDLGDACFGTEYIWEKIDGSSGWARKEDGVFTEDPLRTNVTGLVALQRKEKSRPISEYKMLLFVNEPHKTYTSAIKRSFPIQEVMHFHTAL